MNKAPIIIIGMHRSGTSLLSDLLMELGMFTGKRRGIHAEADLYVRLNNWLLSQLGISWDVPFAINDFYAKNNDSEFDLFATYLNMVLDSPLKYKFNGPIRRIFKPNEVWGFKDPISSLTLPFWLSVYPEAKIIYIKRHGIAVAESLRVRNKNKLVKSNRRLKSNVLYKPYLIYQQYFLRSPRNRGFIDSAYCKNIDYSMRLWDFYNEQCQDHIGNLPKSQKIELKYEDLLINPKDELLKIVELIGPEFQIDLGQIENISEKINPKRAYDFKKKFEESEILRHEEVLNKYNY